MSDPHELPPLSDAENARRLRRQAEAEDLQKRKTLGAEGRLYCIEVLVHHGVEPKRLQMTNYTSKEVYDFREAVYAVGVKIQIEPRRWIICAPWDIKEIIITQQNKFFD